MRFTYAEAMTNAHFYAPLAQAAEAAGYTSMTVADSLIYPEESDSTYPYTDTGDREFLEGKEFIETMMLVHAPGRGDHDAAVHAVRAQAAGAAAGAGGQAGQLGRLAQRQPARPRRRAVPVAGGLPGAWACRGSSAASGWTSASTSCAGSPRGEFFGYDGEFYSIPPMKQTPAPTEKVPLLVGGHADAALRRAVLKGDGWMHAGGDGEELDRLLARLAEIRKAEGDTRDDFEVHVISYDAYDLDGIKRLEDKGVTDCIVGFRVPYIKGPDTEPLETKVEHLNKYADSIISKVAPVSPANDDVTLAFREAVAEAEKLIANPPFEVSEQDLAEGYDYLAGSIRSSLQMAFDYDLEHPVLINPTHQYARQGLDNPDAVYFNAYLDADGSYVVSGVRGTTADLSFQVMDGTYSAEGAPGHGRRVRRP